MGAIAAKEIDSIDDLLRQGMEAYKVECMMGAYGPPTNRADSYFERALELMRQRSIQDLDREYSAQSSLGKFYNQNGQSRKAIPYLERAVEIDPKSITANYNLASAYQKQGRHNQASSTFLKVASFFHAPFKIKMLSFMRGITNAMRSTTRGQQASMVT